MSTKCLIGIEQEDGKVLTTWAVYEGQPQGVGAALLEWYLEPDKVRMLIENGPIEEIFQNVHDTITHPVHPDVDHGPTLYDSLNDMLYCRHHYGAEFAYIFRKGSWHWVDFKKWMEQLAKPMRKEDTYYK